MSKINMSFEIDLEEVQKQIDSTDKISESREVYKILSSIADIQNQVKEIDKAIKNYDKVVKGMIKDKADSEFGDNWQAIKGDGYKITKSSTGSVFAIGDDVDDVYLVTKISADTKLIKEFEKANGELPKGITENAERGVKLTVKLD